MQHEVREPPDDQVDAEPDKAPLPVVPLAALAGSATFAVWTTLTCFVC